MPDRPGRGEGGNDVRRSRDQEQHHDRGKVRERIDGADAVEQRFQDPRGCQRRGVFAGSESPAARDGDSQDLEVVRRHRFARDELRLLAGGEDAAHIAAAGHARERAHAVADVEVVRIRRGQLREVGPQAGVDLDQRPTRGDVWSLNRTPLTILNSVVVRPIPRAREPIAAAANAGWRRNCRTPNAMSRSIPVDTAGPVKRSTGDDQRRT